MPLILKHHQAVHIVLVTTLAKGDVLQPVMGHVRLLVVGLVKVNVMHIVMVLVLEVVGTHAIILPLVHTNVFTSLI